MFAEHRVVQDNLLQKFNELIGQVGGHESFDSNRDLLGVLGLREGGLNNLQRSVMLGNVRQG